MKKRNANLNMTRDRFLSNAEPLKATVFDSNMFAEPREFKTGSVGFYANAKVPVRVDGETVWLQVSISAQAIGSKEWEDGSFNEIAA